jgi:hypothetical protein
MNSTHYSIKTIKDLAAIHPALEKAWREIKDALELRVRVPCTVTVSDEPREMYLNDNEFGKRFIFSSVRMERISPLMHVSGGEWAVHGGPHYDERVTVPPGHVLFEFTVGRVVTMRAQFAPGEFVT